ncbi:MAG: DUF3782 domain-containing protein [Candidatus Caldarchaeum sp.]
MKSLGKALAVRIKRTIFRLLKEDEEFRYAVAGLLGLEEILKRLDRHEAELVKLREDMLQGFRRHDEELASLREETNRLREDMIAGFRRHDEELASLREETNRLRQDMARGFELVNRHLDALGARWGIMAESAFREGLRGILEKELGLVVERWTAYDEDGYVYGYPSAVDVDVAVKDGKTILVEVKSHVRRSDVNEFRRKVEFYGLKTGKPVDRKVMVTPYVEEGALEAAKQLEIEVYTRV